MGCLQQGLQFVYLESLIVNENMINQGRHILFHELWTVNVNRSKLVKIKLSSILPNQGVKIANTFLD